MCIRDRVLLGMLIGLMRWRFAGRYRNGSHSPYPVGAGRLHHVGGLLIGVVLLVWLGSGMLSMEPWGLFEKRSTIDAAALRQPSLLNAEALDTDLASALARFREAGIEPVELQWHVLGDQPYLLAIDAGGETRILPATHSEPAQERLERDLLEREVRQAWPEQQLRFEWLEQEDFHYYSRGEPSLYSHLPRRLPLLRVCFDDPAATWLHIDPYSGTVIEQLDQRRRAVRWVFKLLHSWDWLPLLQRPLLRDGLLLAFSVGMLLIAISGVLLGWRRLRGRPRHARERSVRVAQPPRLP